MFTPPAQAVVLLWNPKYPHNVGGAYRAAACFGAEEVWVAGERVPLEPSEGYRLPREERMRAYKGEVKLEQVDPRAIFDQVNPEITPIAVEVDPSAEQLHRFEHPERALYVFGPEDGSLSKVVRQKCHRFVMIPSYHCLNLAGAVYTVLYDRTAKRRLAGLEDEVATANLMRNEGRGYAEHYPVEALS